MRTRLMLALAAALVPAALLSSTAVAATGVAIANTSQSGSLLIVGGAATFDDQPFAVLGTDATGDTFTPGFQVVGGDMTDASISTKTDGSVQFRWRVTDMPPAPLDGAPTGVIYAWDFCVDTEACFELSAGRQGAINGSTTAAPYGQLWSCGDPGCDPGAQAFISDAVSVTMSAATKSVVATLGAGQIVASPSSVITGTGWSVEGPAFTDISDPSLFPFFDLGDGVSSVSAYTVAAKEISMAVGASGQDPATVAYGAPVAPFDGAGSFSVSANVQGQTGPRTVYVRACFGSNNCAYATRDITLV
jgi:hypothetical protein